MTKKFSINSDNEIRIKLSSNDRLSVEDISKLYNESTDFLIKPIYIKRNSLYYSIPSEVKLCDFLKNFISLKQFFTIIESVLVAVERIKEKNFLEECLIKDLRFVFINEKSQSIKMLYIPVTYKSKDMDMIDFIKQITQSVRMINSNEQIVVNRFMEYIKSQVRFNPEQIVKFLKNCNYDYKGDLDDEDKTDMMDDDVPTEFMDDDSDTELDDDKTELFEDFTYSDPRQTVGVSCPLLKRLSTGEEIYINKSVFRIGKDTSIVDLHVDNPAVSRSHADIIVKDEKYYIVDLKSKNRTLINGTPIPINKEYEIYNEDLITLADEEFIFKV